MSLINDALKKAQRLRNEGASSDPAPIPGGATGAPITKRAQARSANTIVLFGGGALLLVVLSVVLTVYLLNRPTAPAAPPVAVAVAPAPVTPTPLPTTPPLTATNPVLGPPVDPLALAPVPAVSPKAERAPPPTAVETKPVATTSTTPPLAAPATPPPNAATPTPAPSVTTPSRPAAPIAELPPAPAPTSVPVPSSEVAPTLPVASAAALTPAPAAPAQPDGRVTAFVEGVKVAGIRSSGTESRVLMNERVYRVNDIVDRTLGVRLVKVATDSLTFSDANGVNYIKYF